MKSFPRKLLIAGMLLATVASATFTSSAPVAAEEETGAQSTAKYPVLITSGLVGFDAYMKVLEYRIEQSGVFDAYVWSPPQLGVGNSDGAAAEFETKIKQLQAKYPGQKIDVVAYGVGGLAARQYIQTIGAGRNDIDSLVMLATPNQGTQLANVAQEWSFDVCGIFFPICKELQTNSPYLAAMNNPAVPLGDTDYTLIVSREDELIIPYTNAFMPIGGADNVVIQDQCPNHIMEDLGMPFDGVVYSGVIDALWHSPIQLDCGAV
jgi:pimeloyl-ACP methyl ester carboxylesterase